jgi:hypothetical protein
LTGSERSRGATGKKKEEEKKKKKRPAEVGRAIAS